MKISVRTEALARALRTAFRAIPSKTSMPILESFRMEAAGARLVVTASNGEITVKVPAQIRAEEGGVITVPAKKLMELVTLLPDEDILLSTEASTLKIAWSKGSRCMQMTCAEDYPSLKDPDDGSHLDLEAQELLTCLSMTIPSCARDDHRTQLNGVHFDITPDCTRVVGTDTRRLTYSTVSCGSDTPKEFTVPVGAASLLKGAIRKETPVVRITSDSYSACFNLGDVIIQTRLLTGRYPKYMEVIPKAEESSGEAVTGREELLACLRRLATCSPRLNMRLSPMSIIFSARNTDTNSLAVEDCDCSYVGQDLEMAVSAESMVSVLENFSGEKVSLRFMSATKPVVATMPDDLTGGSLSLFMPIQKAH